MIEKKFSPFHQQCQVTFRVAASQVGSAESVYLVGDFNDWQVAQDSMQRKGDFYQIKKNLDPNQSYSFRYCSQDGEWFDDEQADQRQPSPFGAENNVITIGEVPSFWCRIRQWLA